MGERKMVGYTWYKINYNVKVDQNGSTTLTKIGQTSLIIIELEYWQFVYYSIHFYICLKFPINFYFKLIKIKWNDKTKNLRGSMRTLERSAILSTEIATWCSVSHLALLKLYLLSRHSSECLSLSHFQQ